MTFEMAKVCKRVCVRKRNGEREGERERAKEKESETEKESDEETDAGKQREQNQTMRVEKNIKKMCLKRESTRSDEEDQNVA